MTNILQAPLLVNYLYPLLLMFFLSFAILEKIQIFGNDQNTKQINAFISLFIALIFVSAVFPVLMTQNLIQFLTIGLVVIFVSLLLWGFITGKGDFELEGKTKTFMAVLLGLVVFFAVIWAAGLGSGLARFFKNIFSFLFNSAWSGGFWTNAIFVGVIIITIVFALNNVGNPKK